VARARKKSGGGLGGFMLGFLVALLLAAVALFVYFRYQAPRRQVARLPRAVKSLVQQPGPSGEPGQRKPSPAAPAPPSPTAEHAFRQPPFGTSEDVFEAGARVYRVNCARCHGTPGHDAAFGASLHPAAPQLWKKHAHGDVVGVSDDPPGMTYGKVENGIRGSRMPAFAHTLSDRQMWEVSLLLKNADQPLPDPVQHLLTAAKP
jgi:thiosulfate dehydrogenase